MGEDVQADGAHGADLGPWSSPGEPEPAAPPHHSGPKPVVSTDAQLFLQGVLTEAIRRRASDIHIEPARDAYNIRFRIDGMLVHFARRAADEYGVVVNALKVLADLDIAVRHLPQEGHIEFRVQEVAEGAVPPPASTAYAVHTEDGSYYDIRVSVFPALDGEVAVLRVMHRSSALLGLDELGMDMDSLTKVRKMLLAAYGMILVTGPTGSGKTTTLYSLLQELRSDTRNIVTLEDPVEFRLPWLRQSEIQNDRAFTYDRALRSVLRQDPDVLMIGEIRDPATAEYSIRSALAGRIVCSSIHANTTVGTFARLFDLGVPHSLAGHAINGVIAQRLVRKLCSACREETVPSMLMMQHFGLSQAEGPFYHARGCDACGGTGYTGRVGLFSVFVMDDTLRTMIYDQRSLQEVQDYALKEGLKTVHMDAVSKIKMGLTSLEEAARVA